MLNMRELRNAYKILIGKPERNKQLWKRENKQQNNVKMNLKEIYEDVELIHLAQNGFQRLEPFEHCNEP